MSLAGEVSCNCGATLLRQDGLCNESTRDQIVCVPCGARYDKAMVLEAQREDASVVMARCSEGCEARMIKVQGRMGEQPKMKCPECGRKREFDWPKS